MAGVLTPSPPAALTASCYLPVPGLRITLSVAGGMLLLLGVSLGHLVVEDEGDRLFIHFGPCRYSETDLVRRHP